MFPGPRGYGIADFYILACFNETYAVGDEAVIGPVAPADDVACSHAGDAAPVFRILFGIEVGFSV